MALSGRRGAEGDAHNVLARREVNSVLDRRRSRVDPVPGVGHRLARFPIEDRDLHLVDRRPGFGAERGEREREPSVAGRLAEEVARSEHGEREERGARDAPAMRRRAIAKHTPHPTRAKTGAVGERELTHASTLSERAGTFNSNGFPRASRVRYTPPAMAPRFWVLGCVVFPALVPAVANGQALGTCEAVEDGPMLSRLGTELAQNGAWDSAAICFERLVERAPNAEARADALFNQGVAYQSLGRHRDARDAFARWLREHATAADDATRAEAARLYAVEAARVGTLEVRLPSAPALEAMRVRVDGRPVEVTSRTALVEVDPGTHTLVVSAEGYATFGWDGRTTDGASVAVDVSLVPLGGGSVVESAGFWIGMVLLVGAAVGGVALGVYLHDDAQLDPRPGLEVIRL